MAEPEAIALPAALPRSPDRRPEKKIKLLVWDLDNTLWSGVLLEGDDVRVRDGVAEALRVLDGRGILHSIASRNEHEEAMARLQASGLAEYFLYPQINWNSKSESIRRIAELVNIGLDAVAFVDDQPFEREEVSYSLPEILVLDASEVADVPQRPEFVPEFITEDSARRRQLYREDMERGRVESAWVGPREEFLASLNMIFTVARAGPNDLERVAELTLRTNQLNSTGYTYSYDELDRYRQSADYLLLIAELEDRFGSYGKIGLTLIEKGRERWTIKLLLMSCRVIARGSGTILLQHVMHRARHAGVGLRAEFKSTERNRMMLVSYKFANFKEIGREGDLRILEHDLREMPRFPAYVDVRAIE